MAADVSASELIDRCRRGEETARELLFDRHYLRLLAEAQLGRRLRVKCDPSDLVQLTLLEAHRDFAGFQGTHESDLLAWLRRILAHNLYNEARHFATQQRDAGREVSLEQVQAGLEHSSACLGRCLADDVPPPSKIAAEREDATRLADTLARLRVFEGLPTEEVAERMGRTAGAVRMLQLRALTALRSEMMKDQ